MSRRSVVLGVAAMVAAATFVAVLPAAEATEGTTSALPGFPMLRTAVRTLAGRVGALLTLWAELDVTDAQRDTVRQAVTAHKPELLSTARGAVAAGRTLRDTVLDPSASDEAVRLAAAELGRAIGEGAVVRAGLIRELQPAFTEEQRAAIHIFIQGNDEALDGLLAKVEKN